MRLDGGVLDLLVAVEVLLVDRGVVAEWTQVILLGTAKVVHHVLIWDKQWHSAIVNIPYIYKLN